MTLGGDRTAGNIAQQTQKPQVHDPSAPLQDVVRRNRQSGKGGVYAVCSAHPHVIAAAIQQSIEDDSILHLESTSSQVNQFGGYIGQTPRQFAHSVQSAAQSAGLAPDRVLLGGDHLGPFPWRHEASSSALGKASELVRDCVRAGYVKIHLDASMRCADDENRGLQEQTVADRAAILCQIAENTHRELPSGSPKLVYVIGTEVPAPGGESLDVQAPVITAAEHVHQTLETFQRTFAERELLSAWERVIALVVQPGVDFGADAVFDYDRAKADGLSAALSAHPAIVYEAHSTDYQSPRSLRRMVQDHFAILKVGPWLTFAFREALFALAAIERELLSMRSGYRLSQVRDAIEAAMLRNPVYWKSYYHGVEKEVRRNLTYGYSDRCRYYWNEPSVQEEVARLFDNLASLPIPPTVVSQYLPAEYEAIRDGRIRSVPEEMVRHHIRQVVRVYAAACET
jgi:D-tagatose-1,6-bisphosphate aldolase subunit GatZ/KbaZ